MKIQTILDQIDLGSTPWSGPGRSSRTGSRPIGSSGG